MLASKAGQAPWSMVGLSFWVFVLFNVAWSQKGHSAFTFINIIITFTITFSHLFLLSKVDSRRSISLWVDVALLPHMEISVSWYILMNKHSGVIKWICQPIHAHTNPRGRLKWLYAITRMTVRFMCGRMSDLTIFKFRKSMMMHDILLTLKVLNFWKCTSYSSLKPLWSGMGEVVPARTSPTLHPPSPPTVHQLLRLAL